MGDNAVFRTTVRVFFKKQGRIKYISHLDINRCVARALKRSGLPVWHTLGFNPHIYVTFALPLSLGYESVCESMDFRLTEDIPMEQVVKQLAAVCPDGLIPYHAQPAVSKPEVICWADYAVTLEYDAVDSAKAAKALQDFCAQDEILVEKKTKKGKKMMDIKPHLVLGEVDVKGNTLMLSLRTAAGTTLNINPTLLLDAFASQSGITADWTGVVRTAILDKDLNPFV